MAFTVDSGYPVVELWHAEEEFKTPPIWAWKQIHHKRQVLWLDAC